MKRAKTTVSDEVKALLSSDDPDAHDPDVTVEPPAWLPDAPPREQKGSGAWERQAMREAASRPDSEQRWVNRHEARHKRAEHSVIGDLVTSGHGVQVHKVSRAWELPSTCRQCGVLLPISGVDYDVCQFAFWPMEKCRCSPCLERRHRLKRNRGNQPVHCGADECRKAENRERQRKSRAKKAQARSPGQKHVTPNPKSRDVSTS